MVFIGFIVEVLLQFIVVMALLVVISYNYSQAKGCGKEEAQGEWDLTGEEEKTGFMDVVDECLDWSYLSLSGTVYFLIYLLCTLPLRFWLAWNLRDFMNEEIPDAKYEQTKEDNSETKRGNKVDTEEQFKVTENSGGNIQSAEMQELQKAK